MSKNLDGIVAKIRDERKSELPNVDSRIRRSRIHVFSVLCAFCDSTYFDVAAII